MRKYRVDFFQMLYNPEAGMSVMTWIGSCEINDNCVTDDLPLCRKAALNAPYNCYHWDKLKFTRI